MARILLLRSGAEPLPAEAAAGDLDVLQTHEIVPVPEGIQRARTFDPHGARLIVSSKTTVNVLVEAGAGALFTAPFVEQLAAGEETARAMRKAGSRSVLVPERPGAAGILDLLSEAGSFERFLWPRGSDADTAPVEELCAFGAAVSAPVVYVKRAVEIPSGVLDAFCRGEYGAVGVSSLAALDAFLAAVGGRCAALLPRLRWAAIGPGTAKAFESRGLPMPAVPARARLTDLIDLLRET